MKQPPRVLIVDDEKAIRHAFREFFTGIGWQVEAVGSGGAALAALAGGPPFQVIFLDVKLPDADGLELIARLRPLAAETPIVVMTAFGSLDTAIRAADQRILDYLIKPVDLDQAAQLAALALAPATPGPTRPAPAPVAADELIGLSTAMQHVYRCIGMVAGSEATVLITGETGTGKEMVARQIHARSRRRAGPFVAVNCGALPESLAESELFGFVKGAFTGATADRGGRFEAAAGGTLFLDEIGELSPAIQVKLLRFLDQRVVERLGTVVPLPVDVRILAATNRKLAEAAGGDGRFRADLFFRLAVMRIDLPPLRERRQDIPELVAWFSRQFAGPGESPALGDGVLERLLKHDWPGNVRELRNVVQHATIMARGGAIGLPHLPPPLDSPKLSGERGDGRRQALLDAYLDDFDWQAGEALAQVSAPVEAAMIERALRRCHGNRSAAAALLGVHRNTLRKRLD